MVDGEICDASMGWRQVEQYTLSVKVFDCTNSDELDLAAADDLLDVITDRIG